MNILAYVHLRNIYGSTGAGRVARQMVEHLARLPGDDVRVLADREDHRRIVDLVGAPWTNFAYYFFADETSRQQARWLLTDRPRAEDYWGDAQITYCTAESYVPTRRSRSIVTLHDAAYFEQGAHKFDLAFLKQRLKWRLLYRKLAARVDLFHTVSHFSAERIAHFVPALRSRLRVVHNGVPDRFFAPVSDEGEAYLREHGLDARRYLLLPRGLNHRKNADLVLRAWGRLREMFPDVRLVVTSHCEPEYVDRASEMYGDSILLTGFVSDEALCSLYTSAAVVWFPSLYEGFGLPVLEAMACGAPVVASDSSSLPEVAGDAALLVETRSDDKHIEALEGVLDDPRLAAKLDRKGRARAREFTWQRSAQALRECFISSA